MSRFFVLRMLRVSNIFTRGNIYHIHNILQYRTIQFLSPDASLSRKCWIGENDSPFTSIPGILLKDSSTG